jgi:hypothetical protein
VLGTRSIDGTRVVVFSVRGEKGRFAATPTHFFKQPTASGVSRPPRVRGRAADAPKRRRRV